jgi:RimJ/RimL family protein N-acetyltransferase
VRLERSFDYELIRKTLTSDAKAYRAMGEDATVPAEQFEPNRHPLIVYLVAWDGEPEVPAALFVFVPVNAVCFDAHFWVNRRFWGPRARELGRAALGWMFQETAAERITGAIAADLPGAIRYARDCGLVDYGRHPKSIRKGGRLLDLVLLGISKGQ